MKTTAWIGMAAFLCTGCIVQDEDAEAGAAPDRGVIQDAATLDGGGRPRDAAPVPDAQRPEDRGVPVDQGPVPDTGPGPGDIVFDTLLLFDDGSMDDGTGTTGVDFCGVSADCATSVMASAILGGGSICEAEGPGCTTDRSDPTAILDDGSSCAIDSVPSDFISLGTDGQIAVTFDGDLRGCEMNVIEFQGAFVEPWEAYVCDTADVGVAHCLNQDAPVASAPNGGEASFLVPHE